MRKINIQLEDLSHPAQKASHVDIDLDENGVGTVKVYSGYSYDLNGSQWLNSEDHWCSKPVVIPAERRQSTYALWWTKELTVVRFERPMD